MRRPFLFFLLITMPILAAAQTPADAIKATINQLFTALRNADSTALKACFAPDARLQSI